MTGTVHRLLELAVPNLYAVDGSVFPSSGGYNPTLTIQANAWRIADGIVHSIR
jgi:choline dehydrogenase-like flavoprotein